MKQVNRYVGTGWEKMTMMQQHSGRYFCEDSLQRLSCVLFPREHHHDLAWLHGVFLAIDIRGFDSVFLARSARKLRSDQPQDIRVLQPELYQLSCCKILLQDRCSTIDRDIFDLRFYALDWPRTQLWGGALPLKIG